MFSEVIYRNPLVLFVVEQWFLACVKRLTLWRPLLPYWYGYKASLGMYIIHLWFPQCLQCSVWVISDGAWRAVLAEEERIPSERRDHVHSSRLPVAVRSLAACETRWYLAVVHHAGATCHHRHGRQQHMALSSRQHTGLSGDTAQLHGLWYVWNVLWIK